MSPCYESAVCLRFLGGTGRGRLGDGEMAQHSYCSVCNFPPDCLAVWMERRQTGKLQAVRTSMRTLAAYVWCGKHYHSATSTGKRGKSSEWWRLVKTHILSLARLLSIGCQSSRLSAIRTAHEVSLPASCKRNRGPAGRVFHGGSSAAAAATNRRGGCSEWTSGRNVPAAPSLNRCSSASEC